MHDLTYLFFIVKNLSSNLISKIDKVWFTEELWPFFGVRLPAVKCNIGIGIS
jgi:hypothetical protein